MQLFLRSVRLEDEAQVLAAQRVMANDNLVFALGFARVLVTGAGFGAGSGGAGFGLSC